MSEKEKARTGAAASERTMECDSGTEYTTANKPRQGVERFILEGRGNALTGRDISRLAGVPLRRITNIVQAALAFADEKDFQLPHDRAIFQTIRALFRENVTPDGITVHSRLLSAPGIDWGNTDPRNYLAQLMEITPTSANWQEYAKIMHEQAALSRIRDAAAKMSLSASVEDCRPVIASLVEMVGGGNRVEVKSMADMFNSFCDRQDPANAPKYVKFGFQELDVGIYPAKGDIVMIGAEPDVGKTAFSLQCAYQMACDWKVGYFTLETDWNDIADRTISCSIVSVTIATRRHGLWTL